jgi:hypothetical protein
VASKRASKAEKMISQYKMTFSTPEGQAVLKDLLVSCGAMASSFVPKDPHQTSFNEGRREVVNRILSTIEMDPERYITLFSEIEDETGALDE